MDTEQPLREGPGQPRRRPRVHPAAVGRPGLRPRAARGLRRHRPGDVRVPARDHRVRLRAAHPARRLLLGDRRPHPRRPALPAHLRGQAVPGRRRARRGTRTEDRLRPVDPAAGDQLPRAAARPGRGRGTGHPPARGLAGQGRRADRPAAQGRDRGRRRAARVHPRGRAGHRRRGRGGRRGRRGPGRPAPDRCPPGRRARLRRFRPQPRDGQDVHRVRGQAGERRRRTPATGTRWRWRSGPSSAR